MGLMGAGAGAVPVPTAWRVEVDLLDLGFDDTLKQQLHSACEQLDLDLDLIAGRVVRQDRDLWLIESGGGATAANLAGRLRHQARSAADLPVVGDWVAAAPGDPALIQAVLPRRSQLSRGVAGGATVEQVVAANVDTALVVCGLDGDLSLRRIERYVTLAFAGGVVPVVVLNKADLRNDLAAVEAAVVGRTPGVDVIAISALNGSGLDRLAAFLGRGRTLVLVGSSGAGKSTLLNTLLGRQVMATAAVRQEDSRGRHTTTHRQMLLLPSGAAVIDTPGLREIRLWCDDDDLGRSFPQIDALAVACRFRDCDHEHEPGCAVQAAVEAGELAAERLASWRKLRREIEFLDRRRSDSRRFEERQHDRRLGKFYRQAKRETRFRKGEG